MLIINSTVAAMSTFEITCDSMKCIFIFYLLHTINEARMLEWEWIVLLVLIGIWVFFVFFFSLLSVINFSALVLEVVSIQVKVFEVCLHVEAQRDHLRACVVAWQCQSPVGTCSSWISTHRTAAPGSPEAWYGGLSQQAERTILRFPSLIKKTQWVIKGVLWDVNLFVDGMDNASD